MLNYNEFGTGPTLLIAHGLYGSAKNWGVIAKRLSDTRRVITVDMRNHGDSPRFDTNSYPELANDLAEVIEHIGGPIDVLGHSMGGKAAMTLALTRPDLVRSLIVGDIAPVSYSHTQAHFIDAMKAVDLSTDTRRSVASAQLAAIRLPVVDDLLREADDQLPPMPSAHVVLQERCRRFRQRASQHLAHGLRREDRRRVAAARVVDLEPLSLWPLHQRLQVADLAVVEPLARIG